MTITKTANGSYRLKLYVPTEARSSLGILGNYYDKRFKTKKEAKEAELQILIDINTIQKGGALPHQAINGDILFKDFYYDIWWEAYKAGQTTSTISHQLSQRLIIQKPSSGYTYYQCLEIIPLNF